ncbi:hypothetical protein BIV57_09005 [Mangrovactinospora gilvigrisea]|uniref:Peptidase S53 domain-containing protein n=1 Tax=Mangrovactinospora gilvigrisea TaxID=1428644 RepID=A0A1J7BGD9_9ACTN|nr:S53 family peptidase [Mangrovactinospora gilvigrisea]OIV37710.1 hypothetical protein BIV57_09005 [Mangrovactinospora gilvigrisea]
MLSTPRALARGPRRTTARLGVLALALAAAAGPALAASGGAPPTGGRITLTATPAYPELRPSDSDYTQLSAGTTPPTQAQCASVKRRCFTPASTRAAYNTAPLLNAGTDGRGQTIAIFDSYGSDTVAHDLHVYDQAFGVAPLCGEEGVTCASGMPTFNRLALQGDPATKAPPPTSKGPGQEDKAAWDLEVSLDVETAHAMAPGANILLVTTPTAETTGVQGFPQMMAAERYVIEHHLATVVSQSFGAAEESFNGGGALDKLRSTYSEAAAAGITVLASSGDGGSANSAKAPVGKGGSTIPYPTVGWPASDPLVTGVGGTDLCTDPNAAAGAGRVVDSADQPAVCGANAGQGEVAWTGSGGGYSHLFGAPAYQTGTLPAGSTAVGAQRGVPDVALQASPSTGALIYVSLPPDGQSGLKCGSAPCSTGWYDIGGTSLACPQWAALVALADQLNGGKGLGLINPALYRLSSNAATYQADFYDVTAGNNQTDASIPGYGATPGWDPVTGLGSPNAAKLLPDLVQAVNAG